MKIIEKKKEMKKEARRNNYNWNKKKWGKDEGEETYKTDDWSSRRKNAKREGRKRK